MLTAPVPRGLGPTAAAVADLALKGHGAGRIATEIGLTRSAVSYHLRRLGAAIGRGYVGRRVTCEILGRCGPRVGELQSLRIGHVRLVVPGW